VHDGEHNLIAAKKCLEGLKKVIWRLVETFHFNPEHKLNLNYTGVNTLRLRKCHHYHKSTEELISGIVNKVSLYTGGSPIAKVLWFMSGPLYD